MKMTEFNKKILMDTVFSVVQNGFAGKRIGIPTFKGKDIWINKSWIANCIYKEFLRKYHKL